MRINCKYQVREVKCDVLTHSVYVWLGVALCTVSNIASFHKSYVNFHVFCNALQFLAFVTAKYGTICFLLGVLKTF